MIFHDFLNITKSILEEMQKKDSKYIWKVCLQVLWIIILVALIKIPIIAIRDLCMSFFAMTMDSPNFIVSHWYEIFEIGYIVIAIVAFVILFNRKMVKYIKEEEKTLKRLK